MSLLNYLEHLKPSPSRGYYLCPKCDGERLSINLKTGKFSCYSSDCDRGDIYRAVLEKAGLDWKPRPKPISPEARIAANLWDIVQDHQAQLEREKELGIEPEIPEMPQAPELTEAEKIALFKNPDIEIEQIDTRTVIQLEAGNITKAIDDVVEKLALDPNPGIFLQGGQQGYFLARVISPVEDTRGKLIAVANDSLAIDMLTPDSLTYELNKRFNFQKYDKRSKEWVSIDCPKNFANQFLAQGRWKLPRLTAISAIPVLCKTGAIIEKNGYNPETGIYVALNGKFPKVPARPTKEDATQSLELLRDWLKEFSYQKPEHESASLSEKLTAVARSCLNHAPLHAYSAVKPGEGKGTQVKGTAILLEGGHPGSISFNPDGEEFRKKLTSILKTGQRLISIDNVTGVLGGDVLEAVLTEDWFCDRLLGTNFAPKLSTQVSLVANGNNLRFRADMARRTILSVLDSGEEHPEKREFNRNFEEFTQAHRGELVAACLTILRAYIQAGYPNKCKPLGSFEEWSDLVRSSLVWLGMPDPVLTQEEIKEGDETKQTLISFLLAWQQSFGAETQTTRRVIQYVTNGGYGNSSGDLKDILTEIALDKTGTLSPRKLGYYLRAYARNVAGGLRIVEAGRDKITNLTLWKLETISNPDISTGRAETISGISGRETSQNPEIHAAQALQPTGDAAGDEISKSISGKFTGELTILDCQPITGDANRQNHLRPEPQNSEILIQQGLQPTGDSSKSPETGDTGDDFCSVSLDVKTCNGLSPGQPVEVKHPTLGWDNGYIYKGQNVNGLAIVELVDHPGHPETRHLSKVRACGGGK